MPKATLSYPASTHEQKMAVNSALTGVLREITNHIASDSIVIKGQTYLPTALLTELIDRCRP